jgi:hydroxypyruvate isomerase
MDPKFTRREILASLACSAALAVGSRASAAPENAIPVKTSRSAFRHSVCKWCYPHIPLDTLAAAAAGLGLSSIELLNPDEWPVVRAHGLTCAMANGTMTIPKGLNRLEHHVALVPSMIERIQACAEAGLPNVICFSGSRDGMSDEQGLENCAIGLKRMMAAAERHRVTVCMELLNSKLNHPDYMCDHTAWGVELVRRVGSERFKLLYDIYHMQIMEGDIIATIREHASCIAHYHTGGVPGRHEIDGTQELTYPAIMRAIAETGFTGFVAQEFVPLGDPLVSLRAAIKLCSV